MTAQTVRFHIKFHTNSDAYEGSVRNKIAAIKLLRTVTGLGLKESKDVVENSAGRSFRVTLEAFGLLCALRAENSQGRYDNQIDFSLSNVVLEDARATDLIDCT